MTKYGEGEEVAGCECSWMGFFSKKRLDDITDVNTAEKTLMNMWNVHVAKDQSRGVMHLDKVLKDFLTEHCHTLIELISTEILCPMLPACSMLGSSVRRPCSTAPTPCRR